MGHWRDGGIGNMAGHDDRPIEEWTLLEQLADVASNGETGEISQRFHCLRVVAQTAFEFIEPMMAAVRRGEPLPMPWAWQPIDTAPVRFKCLLQNERGEVFEGWAYWVPPPRSRPTTLPKLRWANRSGQCFPKYWMPLPAPRIDP